MFDNKKYNELALIGLTMDNMTDYFTFQFNKWLFKYSDEVKMNGEILSDDEKMMIRLANFNIKPKPNEIITSDRTKEGVLLTEQLFIETEIKRVENIKNLRFDKKYLKDEYLKFLKQKEQTFKTNEKIKLNEKGLLKNEYPHIFKNDEAYTIFKEYIKDGVKKMDYSFLYREMDKDKLILETVKPSNFRDFINENYDIKGGIDKIYTIDKVGSLTPKRKIYNQLKEKYINK